MQGELVKLTHIFYAGRAKCKTDLCKNLDVVPAKSILIPKSVLR